MPELTPEIFDLIAKLIQSKEPARTGARLVLVEGKNNPEAYVAARISAQSLSNTLRRYRQTNKSIREAYKIV